jgi:type I restriction enzyme M protein
VFLPEVETTAEKTNVKLTAKRVNLLKSALGQRDERAMPVVKKAYKPGKEKADQLHGLFEASVNGKGSVAEHEPDSDLRDTEQVPLLEPGGVDAFVQREVLPHVPDAWIDVSSTKIGYEISFTRYFYKPLPLRSLEEIRADILALEKETEGLLDEILGGNLK